MFRPKHYIILVVLVGSLLLLYGMTFLSVKVAPLSGDQSNQVLVTVTETILTVGLIVAVLFSGIFYFMKSRFEDHSHKH